MNLAEGCFWGCVGGAKHRGVLAFVLHLPTRIFFTGPEVLRGVAHRIVVFFATIHKGLSSPYAALSPETVFPVWAEVALR